jgi:uncharacterized protein (TIGR01777 family)
MRILLTGATGFIGRQLARRLESAGHELVLLVRDVGAAARQFPRASHHSWDVLRGPPPRPALEGVDAVIHLAGESVAAGRWTAERKRRLEDSRVQSSHRLMDVLREISPPAPRVVIGASAIGYYGTRADEVLTERSDPGSDFLARVCQGWEAALRDGAPPGVRVVSLRSGLVLGRDGGALPHMARVFRMGLGGRIGSGRQWMSWIHIEDLLSLIQHLLSSELRGPVNAVSPEPVRNIEFTRELARVLRRWAPFVVPAPVLRLTMGEMSVLVLSSQRVVPAAAQASGFAFRFVSLGAALADLFEPVA